jgi:diguanylate cyclase (GGDEF)-like protein
MKIRTKVYLVITIATAVLATLLIASGLYFFGLALVMCDLDSFKEMNDIHGHQIGDAALREAVRVITVSVRHSDFVIRMGGDEFLALLSDTSEDKALEVAERIRSSLEANRFKVAGRELKLTLSLGVSVFPEDSDDFDECMKFADTALYRAKEAGSNLVVRFSENMLPS